MAVPSKLDAFGFDWNLEEDDADVEHENAALELTGSWRTYYQC